MSAAPMPIDRGMPASSFGEPLLEIKGLRVDFPEVGDGPAIDGMDLTVRRGEIVALVGESGSGKSLTALTMMGLLPPGAQVTDGTALLDGEDVLSMSPKRLNKVRGSKVAMLFQQPKVMLDPTARVGGQVAEALRRHRGVGRREAKARVVQMLRDVGIPEPSRRASAFSYQLSGGMAQRVMIAAALSADPELVIADEPTTALDVTVQAQILDLLRRKRDELGLSILLITHDLGIVSTMADRVAVMYAGRIVEDGTTADIFSSPQHPYTEALIKASLLEADRGKLFSIPGSIAHARAMERGCRFLPRCPKAAELGISDMCSGAEPTLHTCGEHEHHSRCHAAPEHAEAS
ncbi:ABC transporter ATP-binding protein [Nocardioides immobilis]|nr:ABC transporter ATP-binding protein [Nocardioides immobilis]